MRALAAATLAASGPLGCSALSALQGLRGARSADGPLEDTFEGGYISDVGQPPSSGGDTVFVFKTYSTFTPWKTHQIDRYADQLAGAGIPVVILRDASALRRHGETLGDGKVRKSFVMLSTGKSVPLCDVSWQAALDEWGQEAFEGLAPKGGGDHDLQLGQGVHNQYEALWWRHCRPSGSEKYVWFVEDDAFFNGDIAGFLSRYSGEDADLISSSFRVAGARWWNFKSFNRSISAGLKLFDATDTGLVENVSPLPALNVFPCGDGADDRRGLIFRQDVVERYSARLFGMLDKALGNRLLAPAEAFLSTLCASGVGLEGGEHCSMMDWAPVTERDSGSTWASPLWCWGGHLKGRQCDAGWQDKWIHPVKTTEANAMACQAH